MAYPRARRSLLLLMLFAFHVDIAESDQPMVRHESVVVEPDGRVVGLKEYVLPGAHYGSLTALESAVAIRDDIKNLELDVQKLVTDGKVTPGVLALAKNILERVLTLKPSINKEHTEGESMLGDFEQFAECDKTRAADELARDQPQTLAALESQRKDCADLQHSMDGAACVDATKINPCDAYIGCMAATKHEYTRAVDEATNAAQVRQYEYEVLDRIECRLKGLISSTQGSAEGTHIDRCKLHHVDLSHLELQIKDAPEASPCV